MPSLIPSRIVLRHSNVQGEKPTESDLLPGEVYLNIPDNKLYYKNRDSITPIIEIDLNTSNDLTHVRDVSLSPEGNLIAVYSDNETKSLGSVVGPPGRGLAIDGIVDYVDQLPDASTIPPIPNILNKNGTLFIVRLGDNISTPFDPAGPRIYAYTSADVGSWDELEGVTVAAGVAGPRGNTILSGTDDSPSNLIGIDGDYYLDTVNYVLFGPKSAGAWPLTGVNIQGPVGADGAVTAESLEQLLDDLGLGPTDIVPVVGLQLSDTGAVTLDSGTLGLNSSGDLIVHNGLSNGDDLPAITAGSTRSLSTNFLIAATVLNNQGVYLRKIGELDIPADWLTVGVGFSISGNVGLQYSQTFPTLDGKPLGGVGLLIGLGDFLDTDPDEIFNYTNFFSLDFVAENNLIKTVKDFQIKYNSQISNSGDPNEIDVFPNILNGTQANIVNSYLITPSVGGSQPEYSTEIISGWDKNIGDIFTDVLNVLPANTPNKLKLYAYIDPVFSEVSTNIEIYLNANIAKSDIVNI